MQEAIEAPKVARLDLVAVSQRAHPCDVLAHECSEVAGKLRQRSQPLQGALVVLFEQCLDDRVQAPAVFILQRGQGVGAVAGGGPPVQIARDQPRSVHDIRQRRTCSLVLEPRSHGLERERFTVRRAFEHEHLEGPQVTGVGIARFPPDREAVEEPVDVVGAHGVTPAGRSRATERRSSAASLR